MTLLLIISILSLLAFVFKPLRGLITGQLCLIKKNTTRKILFHILAITILFGVFSTSALADTGPKPSVVVDFKGLENETYYVTLLSEEESTGPWSKSNEYDDWAGEEEEIWEKLNSFEDSDGFNFLGYYEDCSESDSFRWNYYPPSKFKILIFFPEYEKMVVSNDSYERYAFDSYFTADASKLNIASVTAAGEEMPVTKKYNFTGELASLLLRMLVTIVIELFIAILFGFRAKKQIIVIILTNIATQGILNVLLNLINYKQGAFYFVLYYLLFEVVVFILEGLLYANKLKRYAINPEKKSFPWLYTLVANIASFVIGMLLIAAWAPGMF